MTIKKGTKEYTYEELNRVFITYLEPLSKGARLTKDEWEVIINRVPGFQDRARLKVKLVDFISKHKSSVVVLPEVIFKDMHILKEKERKLKKEVKSFKKKKIKVPSLYSIQKSNIVQAKKFAGYFDVSTAKKIARYTKPIKIYRTKKKELRFKIEGDVFAQPEFEVMSEKSRLQLKKSGELKTVLSNLRRLRSLQIKSSKGRGTIGKRLKR